MTLQKQNPGGAEGEPEGERGRVEEQEQGQHPRPAGVAAERAVGGQRVAAGGHGGPAGAGTDPQGEITFMSVCRLCTMHAVC